MDHIKTIEGEATLAISMSKSLQTLDLSKNTSSLRKQSLPESIADLPKPKFLALFQTFKVVEASQLYKPSLQSAFSFRLRFFTKF
jgi:hypothetical protein